VRILIVAGDLQRACRRLDLVEPNDASLRLRDDLLREDDDVAVLDLDLRRDELCQIVALADLRQTRDGNDAELAGQGRPVRRMPACVL
jgi:hypothetical protein